MSLSSRADIDAGGFFVNFNQDCSSLAAGRAFASAVLPVAGLRHSCVITTIQKALRLLVASQDGYLYVYQLPLEGGECQLIKKHDLRIVEPMNTTRPESLPIGVPTVSAPGGGASYAAALKGASGASNASGSLGSAAIDHQEEQQQQQQQ
ncbi:Autophagy-specific protein [Culex quinquefasciatus]|uniref:Autophagy-specific protein n=1 Tax=Culex quinquefasciatus TaxID=7176 RepID=B0WJZ2_CULQU|nr:Autophagy-specific protein [Culex quinquefasciatus]|eukprot:XP_001849026.1 Autophagy-specific protein [Culex quinquefasciatus]